jgi:ubiquinone/menaquinone biosynthesis C-methylase UbiE
MVAELDRYYVSLGAAFARGRLGLVGESDEASFREGLLRGLPMQRFRRLDERLLARVRCVLSMLEKLAPASVLDVGSGRGAFLWPLLDAFRELEVTAVDLDAERVAALAEIGSAVGRLSALAMDAKSLDFEDAAFDGVTLLEVLEHLPDPTRAAAEALRVARRFVIASVPSKADGNPEHVHLFDRASLAKLFADARSVSIEEVPDHLVALALTGTTPP